MIARRTFALEVNDGEDEVMFGVALPNGSIVTDVRIKGAYVCGTVGSGPNQFPITSATMVAMEGYVLPVLDPDAALTWDGLWDRLVPKDSDTETIDLATGAADTTSFFEPGEIAMANLLDVGLRPKRVYHMHKLLTAVQDSVHTHQVISTPADAGRWTPGGSYQVRINRPMRVSQPSGLVFAFGVPFMDDTTAVDQPSLLEVEWGQVKYMEHTLERALLHQFGVFEVGAETPWEEASALLRKHLNPDVFEDTTGQFLTPGEFQVYGEASITHLVTGRLSIGTVSTGR